MDIREKIQRAIFGFAKKWQKRKGSASPSLCDKKEGVCRHCGQYIVIRQSRAWLRLPIPSLTTVGKIRPTLNSLKE